MPIFGFERQVVEVFFFWTLCLSIPISIVIFGLRSRGKPERALITYLSMWERILEALPAEKRAILEAEKHLRGNDAHPEYVRLYKACRQYANVDLNEEDWAGWWTALSQTQRYKIKEGIHSIVPERDLHQTP
ncbi:MAG: hypothetical protein ACC618_02685 [Patescibacteria group bacterium]